LLDNNSFILKLTKSKSAFIIIIIVIISSSLVSNYINNYFFWEFGPDWIVKAIELDQKPIEFIPFSKLDSYDIQTIFNSSTGVQISFKVHNEIRNLLSNHETYNVEYGNDYYILQFTIANGTETPTGNPIPLIVLSSVISIISIIAIIFLSIIILVNALKILRRAGIL